MNDKKYELKIESEIGGGSLSIFKDGEIFHKSEGFLIDKKSDYLIEVLKETLAASQIKIENLKVIKYSVYPGSQMGLKILASIVKGFSLPYEIDILEKNIFSALFDFYKSHIKNDFGIVLPINGREFTLEFSSHNASKSIEKFKVGNLLEKINELYEGEINVVLPLKIFENILQIPHLFSRYDSGKFIDTGDNLSVYL